MIHFYTGDGKGKTTAALGLLLRTVGAGGRVTLLQFFKGGPSAELCALSRFPEVRVLRLSRDYDFWWKLNAQQQREITAEHDRLLAEACGEICDLLILDELLCAYRLKAVNCQAVETLLSAPKPGMEIALTGRDAPEELAQYADYISEIRNLRHPYDRGIAARKGIEF